MSIFCGEVPGNTRDGGQLRATSGKDLLWYRSSRKGLQSTGQRSHASRCILLWVVGPPLDPFHMISLLPDEDDINSVFHPRMCVGYVMWTVVAENCVGAQAQIL